MMNTQLLSAWGQMFNIDFTIKSIVAVTTITTTTMIITTIKIIITIVTHQTTVVYLILVNQNAPVITENVQMAFIKMKMEIVFQLIQKVVLVGITQ